MIRAFVAVPLPAPVQRALGSMEQELQKRYPEGRFIRPESIHLTLKFLGNIHEHSVSQVAQSLQSIGRETSPFEVEVAGLGRFPPVGRPRVIWVGVQGLEPLSRLQEKVEQAMESLGFPREERPFRPHLTLLRVKSAGHPGQLVEFLRSGPAGQEFGRVTVDRMHVFQSLLNREGTEYRELATAPLSGTEENPHSFQGEIHDNQ